MGDRVHSLRENRSAGFTILELLIVLVLIAVLAAIALSIAFYAFDVSRAGRTVSDLRGVSTAILKYETDNSGLPGGGLQPVSDLESLLAVHNGGILASEDGWGKTLYYEDLIVDGTNSFRLYSYGKDGTPDGAITGNYVDFYTDIVIESGSFIQTKW